MIGKGLYRENRMARSLRWIAFFLSMFLSWASLVSAAPAIAGINGTGTTGMPPAQHPATITGHGEALITRDAGILFAQFQLPPASPQQSPAAQGLQIPRHHYAFRAETKVHYRRNNDLDKRLRDNSTIAEPQLKAFVGYRLNSWSDLGLQLGLKKAFALQEEKLLVLPSGEVEHAPKRPLSFSIKQAYVRLHNITDLFEFTIGRRTFEDDRHWLFDTDLDAVIARLKHGYLTAEASVSRLDWRDLDLARHVDRGRVNNYLVYSEYRGIEDSKLAAYVFARRDHDPAGDIGRPVLMGVRAYSTLSARALGYWTELALLRGRDESAQKFSAHAVDAGVFYRFKELPWQPTITAGYATASGDRNPGDGRNQEFRQTGFHTNESRITGIAKFKTYGEALDPELSNLQLLTLGIGVRPRLDFTIDLIYHHYRLDALADALRDTAITAEMNLDPANRSRNVGSEVDLIFGFRGLFGLPRLSLDFRMGLFMPGRAFRRTEGSAGTNGDNAFSFLTKVQFLW